MNEQKLILKKDVKYYLTESLQFYKQKSQVVVALLFTLLVASFLLIELWDNYLLKQVFGSSDIATVSNQLLDIARRSSYEELINFFSPNADLFAYTFVFSLAAFVIKFFIVYIYASVVLKDYRPKLEIAEKKFFTLSKVCKTFIAFLLYEMLVAIISGGIFYIIFMYFILLRLMMYLPSILDGDRGTLQSFSKSSEYSKYGGVPFKAVVSMFFSILLLILFVCLGLSFLDNTNIYIAVTMFLEAATTFMTVKLSIILYYDIKVSLITDYGLNDNN